MTEKDHLYTPSYPENLYAFFPLLLVDPLSQQFFTSLINVFSLLKPGIIFLNENEPMQDTLLPADVRKKILIQTFHCKALEKLKEFDPEYKFYMRVNELALSFFNKESDTGDFYRCQINDKKISNDQYEEKIIKEGLSDRPLFSLTTDFFIQALQSNIDELLKFSIFYEPTNTNKSTIVKRAINAYTESLISNRKLDVFSNILFLDQYYEITKKTSDVFAREVLEILNQWLKRNGIKYSSPVLVSKDGRMSKFMSPEKIRDYFMTLTTRRGRNGQYIMATGQVEHFLHANFQGFDPSYKKRKFQNNFKTTKELVKFFYELSEMDSDTQNKSKVYTDIILNNFKIESKSLDLRKYILKHFTSFK